MTPRTQPAGNPVRWGALASRAAIGAAIGLALISFFLFSAPEDSVRPEWGYYWMIRPLIIVTLAGAAGGFFHYTMDPIRSRGGWNTLGANTISLVVFVFSLWIGSVLGLAGTYWD